MVEVSNTVFEEQIVLQTDKLTKKIVLEPKGRVLALLTRDFPVLETMLCLVPAVLAGNSILLKDHTGTPTIAQFFEDALQDSAPGLAQKFFVDPLGVQRLYEKK